MVIITVWSLEGLEQKMIDFFMSWSPYNVKLEQTTHILR